MRLIRCLLLVVAFSTFVPVAPALAVECAATCPSHVIADLNVLSQCLKVPSNADPTDPTIWCNSVYVRTGTATCSSCDPINYPVKQCARKTEMYTNPVSPYNLIIKYSCTTAFTTTNYEPLPCCTPAGPAACQGACGSSGCSVGTCTGGRCVNTGCPADADCVCDEEPPPPDPTCSVSLTGDTSVEAGSVVSYDVAVTGDGTPTTLRLSAPGFDDGDGNSTFAADGFAMATFWMYAPDTTGTRTLSASATTSEASCSRTLTVNVTQPIVSVTVNAYEALDLSDCAGTDRVPLSSAHLWSGVYDSTIYNSSPAVFSDAPGNYEYYAEVTPNNTSDTWLYVACGDPSSFIVGTESVSTDFFFTRQMGSWFQVLGGDVGANANLRATIPADQTLMADNYSDSADSSGVALAAGTAGVTGGTYGPVDRNWSAGSSAFFLPPQEGYTYFSRLYEMGSAPDPGVDDVMDFETAEPYKTETNALGLTEDAYYREDDLEVGEMSIDDGSIRTVFVNGDLTIDGDVLVGYGSFLAFIVSGSITIEPNVSAVQGVYIADGQLIIRDGEGSGGYSPFLDSLRQFEAQGIFVGWSGVILERDLVSGSGGDETENNLYPASRFIYRPDFLVNAPAGLKRSGIAWREVAPGTTQE